MSHSSHASFRKKKKKKKLGRKEFLKLSENLSEICSNYCRKQHFHHFVYIFIVFYIRAQKIV